MRVAHSRIASTRLEDVHALTHASMMARGRQNVLTRSAHNSIALAMAIPLSTPPTSAGLTRGSRLRPAAHLTAPSARVRWRISSMAVTALSEPSGR